LLAWRGAVCSPALGRSERIAHLGEVVDGPVVHKSPHGWICPSCAMGEANFASHRQLSAAFAHLPYCSGYTLRLVEIERRKPRIEWLDLAAGIDGAEVLEN
jgi:hypothetical protein